MDARGVKHRKGVARAVPDREYDLIGLQIVAARKMQPLHATFARAVGVDVEPVDLVLPAIFAAQPLDRLAQAFDHRHQPEGADMRVRFGEDFRRRARLDEFGQHLAVEMPRVFDPAVELAVGKGARAAFAELNVRFGVQHAAPPQIPCVLGALANDLAAIEDDRPEAHLRKDQPREQPARPRADDDRPLHAFGRLGDEFIAGVRRLLDVAVLAKAREHGAFVLHIDVDRIDQLDVGLVARIMRAPRDDMADQFAGADAQPLADCGGQILRRMVQR